MIGAVSGSTGPPPAPGDEVASGRNRDRARLCADSTSPSGSWSGGRTRTRTGSSTRSIGHCVPIAPTEEDAGALARIAPADRDQPRKGESSRRGGVADDLIRLTR